MGGVWEGGWVGGSVLNASVLVCSNVYVCFMAVTLKALLGHWKLAVAANAVMHGIGELL